MSPQKGSPAFGLGQFGSHGATGFDGARNEPGSVLRESVNEKPTALFVWIAPASLAAGNLPASMALGESLHVQGKAGADRAKVWLEKTGRVEVNFSRYEVGETPFLTFTKPNDKSFSFDIGGILRLDSGNVQFLGEVKKVTSEAGQGPQYREYLAKCYRASKMHGQPYHFMWVTWHPFNIGIWPQLCTASVIKTALEEHKDEFYGEDPIDESLCEELAERLWLIVLSDRQESLAMSDAMLGTLRKAIVEGVTP